jgi:tRNA dimethylallyltransferase
VGKTALAVDLCKRTEGAILSMDSRQVYRGLAVASNAPTPADLDGVSCHLVGVLDLSATVNAATFVGLARQALTAIRQQGLGVVITAGTGLYLSALLDGLDLGGIAPDPALRAELEDAVRRDLPTAVARLRQVDPEAAARIDTRNPVRVVRRLELALLRQRGEPSRPSPAAPPAAHRFGLTAPMPTLRGWIEERVDRMLSGGLVEEVRRLLDFDPAPSAQVMRGIGVTEMATYLRGEASLGQSRAAMIQRTRRYARRQLTWFRADPRVRWFDVTAIPRSDIVELMLESTR